MNSPLCAGGACSCAGGALLSIPPSPIIARKLAKNGSPRLDGLLRAAPLQKRLRLRRSLTEASKKRNSSAAQGRRGGARAPSIGRSSVSNLSFPRMRWRVRAGADDERREHGESPRYCLPMKHSRSIISATGSRCARWRTTLRRCAHSEHWRSVRGCGTSHNHHIHESA